MPYRQRAIGTGRWRGSHENAPLTARLRRGTTGKRMQTSGSTRLWTGRNSRYLRRRPGSCPACSPRPRCTRVASSRPTAASALGPLSRPGPLLFAEVASSRRPTAASMLGLGLASWMAPRGATSTAPPQFAAVTAIDATAKTTRPARRKPTASSKLPNGRPSIAPCASRSGCRRSQRPPTHDHYDGARDRADQRTCIRAGMSRPDDNEGPNTLGPHESGCGRGAEL